MKQKNKKWLFSLIAMGLVLTLATSCKKEEVKTDETVLPVLTTSDTSNVTHTSVTSGGNITSDGGTVITVRGVCYSMTAAPTIADCKTTDGSGTDVFTSSITGLTGYTTYYIRAYATNSKGTAYGAEIAFKTLDPAGEDGYYDPSDEDDW